MDHSPERVYTPRKSVRSQAVRLSGREGQLRSVAPLRLAGYRRAYSPGRTLAYAVVIGLVGIAGIAGAGWAIDRIADATDQNTQSVKDEERFPVRPTATPDPAERLVTITQIAQPGEVANQETVHILEARRAALLLSGEYQPQEPSK